MPVEVIEQVRESIELAVLQGEAIVAIYRIGGSVIDAAITTLSSPMISNQNITSLWSNASAWTLTPSDFYNQSLDLNALSPFTSQISINMYGSLFSSSGAGLSSTFTSATFPFFSDFSWAVANTNEPCAPPFSYNYMSSKDIWVLWCPLQELSTNQISIYYPYCNTVFGTNYPFSSIFAYAVSTTTTGTLLAYRQ